MQLSIESLKNSINEVTKTIRESFKPLIEITKSIQLTNPLKGMIDSIKNSISQIALSSAAKINLNPFNDNITDDKEPEEEESEDKESKDNNSE